jgi:hypothetical protein
MSGVNLMPWLESGFISTRTLCGSEPAAARMTQPESVATVAESLYMEQVVSPGEDTG